MAKITEKIAALPPGSSFHSLEFFPPKTEIGFQNLHARLERMTQALRPLFVTVTWGAGGSTSTKSLQLAEICQNDLSLTTCLHLTCTNMSKKLLDEALETCKRVGIRNILALRGDPPRNDEYFNGSAEVEEEEEEDKKEFVWAVDLVRYIREKYNDYFCIGVAAYPEGHAEGTAPEHQDPKHDLPYLIEKVKAGADFIMTQLFYDVDKYISFEHTLRSDPSGVFTSIPILPGLMPIQSYHILRRTTKLSNATIPPCIHARLDPIKNDDAKVKLEGIDILSEIVSTLRKSTQTRGFHFYTLNLEKVVSFIIERSKLIPTLPSVPVFDADFADAPSFITRNRRLSQDANNHLIIDGAPPAHRSHLLDTASHAGQLLSSNPADQPPSVALAISEGEGALGREATWDDFPNGRFGDARSPAFGDIDGYGPSLHMSRSQAVKLWGHPVCAADISAMLSAHIEGKLSAIPWSEQELNDETRVIKPQLLALNKKGWWTIASQPAVNCVSSEDATFGWGPKGGFVWQKAFVEFFCPEADVHRLVKKLKELGSGKVSFYAAKGTGEGWESDVKEGEGAVNAVTWGAFKAKEIVTPTIIEEINFKAWKEEAFTIWKEWSRVYPPRSATSKFLGKVAESYWLVNVIHHEFPEKNALWDLLIDL